MKRAYPSGIVQLWGACRRSLGAFLFRAGSRRVIEAVLYVGGDVDFSVSGAFGVSAGVRVGASLASGEMI